MTRSRRHRNRSSAVCAVFATAVLAVLGTNRALGAYDPLDESWQGSAYLARTAQEAKVQIQWLDEVNWAERTPEDVLVLIYPQMPLPIDDLERFLADGGRLVIADDFGTSRNLLARHGIVHSQTALRHRNFLVDRRAFPILTSDRDHFLFFNITSLGESLVANHPASFIVEPPASAIVTYDDPRQVFAAEVRVGDGAMLAIADASMFINEMLYQHGNKQFVANSLRYYCKGDPCRAVLVQPSAPWLGRYQSKAAEAAQSWGERFQKSASDLNDWLSGWNSKLTPTLWLRLLGFAALGLLASLLVRLFTPVRPLRRFGWEHHAAVVQPEAELLARGLEANATGADFTRPALALVALVQTALGVNSIAVPLAAVEQERIATQLLRDRPAPAQERGLIRNAVLRILGAAPSLRHSAVPLSHQQFLTLRTDAERILQHIGATEPGRWERLLWRLIRSRPPGSNC